MERTRRASQWSEQEGLLNGANKKGFSMERTRRASQWSEQEGLLNGVKEEGSQMTQRC